MITQVRTCDECEKVIEADDKRLEVDNHSVRVLKGHKCAAAINVGEHSAADFCSLKCLTAVLTRMWKESG